MSAPLVELSFPGVGTQIRIAAMVEDEFDFRALFDKTDRPRQLARRNADVKCQAVIFERSDVLDESGRRRESVRFGVEYAAHPFQQPLPRDPVYVFAEVVVFRAGRRDDARNRVVVSPGQREDVKRLLEHEFLVNVGLDVNRFGDRQIARRLLIVARPEAAVERGPARRPRVGKLIEVPEVLMRVNDFHTSRWLEIIGWWLARGSAAHPCLLALRASRQGWAALPGADRRIK